MHVMHGGLEEVLKRSQLWLDTKVALRDIGLFLNDRPLRFRFRARCCPSWAVSAKFKYWSRTDVEFDFEFLELLLVPLDAILADFIAYFDVGKMRVGRASPDETDERRATRWQT